MLGLEWNPEIKVGDILILIGFVFTTAGLIFAGRGIQQNTRAQRAKFLLEFTERYFSDSDIRRFYYKIDYNQFEFDLQRFIGSDEERWLDSLIYTFDLIGYLLKMGVLSTREVSIIAFQASRALRNSEVRKYLNWLDVEYKREGRPTPVHSDALYLVQTVLPTLKRSDP
jgi:hypothetical protein